MSNIDSKARDLFMQALDQPAEQVADWLADACGNDSELRQRVQALLDAHQKAGGFLGTGAEDQSHGSTAADDTPDNLSATVIMDGPKAGVTIGPYKLLEQIGEGGMGSVWVASQSQPIKRRVAIKLIKAGMDTGQVLARFEAERQALAMMDHPNIARVLDGGITDQGRPYFAMEYVKGVPLTEYCDNAKLSLKERLELFVPVCQAVQHAHQKGIIHRDLKPANILVCLYDGRPVPKVIDFGLAKAMHQSLTEKSIYTAHGMMVGTPLYMSPEQAELNNLDIDTRTDIYSLGVILYELLTGTTPLEKAQMKQAAFDEVLRLIKEVEPPKPSTRLSGSESLPSVAAQRGIEPTQLTRSITGDLDWVVMKALEKERSRRYETANGLAEDIRRHLCDEPVGASPPSTSYRMKKFIRRNRAGVIAASAIAVTLLLGVAGTTSGMLWALSEQRLAVDARKAETEAKLAAEANARLAEEEAVRATAAEAATAETLKEVEAERDAKEVALKEAEQLSEFLTGVFQSPDPTKDGREVKVVELLDNAAKTLETDLVDQPRQRAKFQERLGITYQALGLDGQAIPLFERVRDYLLSHSGPEQSDTLSCTQKLAICYHRFGRGEEARQLLEEVLPISRKANGPEHALTLTAMSRLAIVYSHSSRIDEAITLAEEVLRIRRRVNGPQHSETLESMVNLANYYAQVGRKESIQLREEVLPLLRKVQGSEHPNTLIAMYNLANAYSETGRKVEALQMREDVLKLRRTVLGPEHPDTLQVMLALANSYDEAGRNDEALRMREEVLELVRRTLGPEHPSTLTAMAGLANSYSSLGRNVEAMHLLEQVVPLRSKLNGSEHPGTLHSKFLLALSYHAAGRIDEAITLAEEVLTLRRKMSPEHPQTLPTMHNLALFYFRASRMDEAITLQEELLTLSHKVFDKEHPDTLNAMSNLAVFYAQANRMDEVITLQEEVLKQRRKVLGQEHTDTFAAMQSLAISFARVGRIDEALTMWEELFGLSLNVKGAEHRDTRSALHQYTMTALSVAVRQVWQNKTEQHAELVRQLINTVSDCDLPYALERTAKIACLAENADSATYRHAVQLARRAVELGKDDESFLPWGRIALGMALYRTGKFVEADEVLAGENPKSVGGDETAELFRAMALFRQGKEDAARELLIAAKEKMEPLPDDAREVPKGIGLSQLWVWVAYREADAMINK